MKNSFLPKLTPKTTLLGIQHLFAMFGATVIVPISSGLNPAVAIFTAGLGTLIFHWITKGKVPVFLGSSFMFMGAITTVVSQKGIPAAQGGIMAAGAVYILLSFFVKLIGSEKIKSFFPPVVTGPVIIVIGLSLAPVGIAWSSSNWAIAILVAATFVLTSMFARGFYQLVPALLAITVGYVAAIISDVATGTTLVNLAIVSEAPLISPFWKMDGSFFTLPAFDLEAIIMIAPIAIVTFMEHLGDLTTNGVVVGKNFFADPGLDKTILGDGVATFVAGMLGGPSNTTYSENTGVLAVTKVYDPAIIRLAAVFAIVLALFGKFAAVLTTIPLCVIGGAGLILYGMIASVGIRTLAEAQLDFGHSRNLLIVALILVLGLGLGGSVTIFGLSLNSTVIAVITGCFLNAILPKEV